MATDTRNPLPDERLTYLSRLLGKPEPPYYTGAQTQVMIGETFLLNAIDVTWNQNFEHTPYFGYRAKEYDWVFSGRGIVQGVLVLNLLDNHLLDLVCSRSQGALQENAVDREGRDVTFYSLERDLTTVMASQSGADLPRLLDELQLRSTQLHVPADTTRREPPPQRAIETLRWLKGKEKHGIDIKINMGDPAELGLPWSERRASTCEIVRGVIFTGENRAIQSGAGILAQGFTYFAKRVDRL